jgi:hypothetical protein
MDIHPLNTRVRLKGTFTKTFTGELYDPTEVRIYVQPPVGSAVQYSSLGGDLTHEATGIFYVDLLVDQPGKWSYKAQAIGKRAITSPDMAFLVDSSVFTGLIMSLRRT